MKLHTLGTSHGATEPNKACSVNLLEVNGAYYLFDCGGNAEGKITDRGIEFDAIRAVFISHMHEDHAGTLSAIVKRFLVYNKSEYILDLHLPEQAGIEAFKGWISALHLDASSPKTRYHLVGAGIVYSDENITVTAIPTKHLMDGKFPSYAYMVESADKRFLYTGDLNYTFCDYPSIVFEQQFDLILCELVHFKPELHLEQIIQSKTKKMVFTHTAPTKAARVLDMQDQFPFPIDLAKDGDIYEI